MERGEAIHLGRDRPPETERNEGEGSKVGEPRESGEERVGGEGWREWARGAADDGEPGDAASVAGNGKGGGGRGVAEGSGVRPSGKNRRVLEEAWEAEKGPGLGTGERLRRGAEGEKEEEQRGDGDGNDSN